MIELSGGKGVMHALIDMELANDRSELMYE